MKKELQIIVYLFLGLFMRISAQQITSKTSLAPEMVSEKVTLVTDRSLYVVKEQIQFEAVYLVNYSIDISDFPLQVMDEDFQWSKVLYIDVLDKKGNAVLKNKFELLGSQINGNISIPEYMPSGVYTLRAYTKWMQNDSARAFATRTIKLINPLDFVLDNMEGDSVKTTLTSKKENKPDSLLVIHLENNEYQKREPVKLNIQLDIHNDNHYVHAVSVVKKGVWQEEKTNAIVQKLSTRKDSVRFTPDFFAHAISGQLIGSEEEKVAAGVQVQLAQLGKKAYLSTAMSDENGNFILNLPSSNENTEYYISSPDTNAQFSFHLFDGFSNDVSLTNTTDFNAIDYTLASELSINAQITERFTKTSDLDKDSILVNRSMFYGAADKVYKVQKYIDLPDVGELIFELIPEFRVQKRKGKSQLLLNKTHSFSNYPILVMVDNIPVYNLNSVLSIPLKKVDRIEIIEDGYLIGPLKYQAIFHVISKKKDFAGIQLPDNAQFFTYSTPKNSTEWLPYNHEMQAKRIPDRRNCLLWIPNMQMHNGSNEFTFFTGDVLGEYEIILQSISTKSGEIQTSKLSFSVH